MNNSSVKLQNLDRVNKEQCLVKVLCFFMSWCSQSSAKSADIRKKIAALRVKNPPCLRLLKLPPLATQKEADEKELIKVVNCQPNRKQK